MSAPDGSRRVGWGRRLRAGGVEVVLVGLVAAYLVGLVRHGPEFDPLVDGWLGILTTVLPSLVLLEAARGRTGAARREQLLLAAGALCWSAGAVYLVVSTAAGREVPFPSWADAGYLAFPVLVTAALINRVRRELAGSRRGLWLDATVGALGASCGVAVLLGPVFAQASGQPLETALALAYPLSDLVLVATIAAVTALYGLRPGASWLWLMAGVGLFAVADVVYALRVTIDAYSLGTPLDLLWSLGLTVLAVGSRRTPRPQRAGPGHQGQRAALVVPAAATVIAVLVLVLGRWLPVTPVATGLAAVTLLAAAIRTQLAFQQVVRLHDLGRQARTDSLTGLGNRRALHERLQQSLTTAPATRPDLAVLLIDLDRFKEINDTLGHHVGDELLRQIGPRLAAALRPGDLLVRLGGDEFAVVLDGVDATQAEQTAERLLVQLTEPFELDGVLVRVGASVGIAVCPLDADEPNGLLQRADVAMYVAKAAGGGARRYDPTRDQHSRERLRTIEELTVVLDDTKASGTAGSQLEVHYQPQCDVRTGAVVGVEALVRWQHPTRGLLYPDVFLPMVEQTGLMPALIDAVLTRAVQQCRQWRQDGLDVGVSVNLSASSLIDQRLPDHVAWLLASSDLPASALTLELTENTLMVDPEQCLVTLQRLKELGVSLSIDDYGTGYCSLSYLQKLPVDELKLDRAFVTNLHLPRDRAIVASTVGLAHALDLRLVAEGVENQASLDLLRQLGCDTAQGYHLSRPLTATAMTGWLRQRNALYGPDLQGVVPC